MLDLRLELLTAECFVSCTQILSPDVHKAQLFEHFYLVSQAFLNYLWIIFHLIVLPHNFFILWCPPVVQLLIAIENIPSINYVIRKFSRWQNSKIYVYLR